MPSSTRPVTSRALVRASAELLERTPAVPLRLQRLGLRGPERFTDEESPVAELGDASVEELAADYSNYGAAEGALRAGCLARLRGAQPLIRPGSDRRTARSDGTVHATGRTGSSAAARSSRLRRPSAGSSSSTSATSPAGWSTARAPDDGVFNATSEELPGASCSPAPTSRGCRTSSSTSTRSASGWSCRCGSRDQPGGYPPRRRRPRARGWSALPARRRHDRRRGRRSRGRGRRTDSRARGRAARRLACPLRTIQAHRSRRSWARNRARASSSTSPRAGRSSSGASTL